MDNSEERSVGSPKQHRDQNHRTIVIVGAVAGGASCAARLRRMDETAAIIVFERRPYASFANCGITYRVGGVIPRDEELLVTDASVIRERFSIKLRLRLEVVAVDRDAQELERKQLSGTISAAEHPKAKARGRRRPRESVEAGLSSVQVGELRRDPPQKPGFHRAITGPFGHPPSCRSDIARTR